MSHGPKGTLGLRQRRSLEISSVNAAPVLTITLEQSIGVTQANQIHCTEKFSARLSASSV